MRFTLVKDLSQDRLMRPVLTGLLLSLVLFFISDILQKKEQIGLHVKSASLVLYGDEENYLDPISIVSLLEMLHNDLFMMMMSLLTLSAIYIRLSKQTRITKTLIHLLMSSALFSLALILAAFYLDPLFLSLWIFSLWLWHILAIFMSLEALIRLYHS